MNRCQNNKEGRIKVEILKKMDMKGSAQILQLKKILLIFNIY